MKRITEQTFKGFFVDRHHRKKIEFNEKILINKDVDLFKQLKKHLDKKFKVNVQIEYLPNGKDFRIIDVLEKKPTFNIDDLEGML